MRNLLALIGLLVVAFLGLGAYLGWYKVSRQPSSGDDELKLDVNVNTKKIKDDARLAAERGGQLIDDLRKGRDNGTPPTAAPAPTQGVSAAVPPPAQTDRKTPAASLPGPFTGTSRAERVQLNPHQPPYSVGKTKPADDPNYDSFDPKRR